MSSLSFVKYIIAGQLKREFIITPSGSTVLDKPGGSALYAAAGAAIWDNGIGLVGRVGNNFPPEWLDQISRAGFDIRGIKILDTQMDHRAFFAYADSDTCETENPVKIFSNNGIPFPKTLIGYSSDARPLESISSPNRLTIRANDIPTDYKDATAAHIGPLDYLTHSLLPSSLRHGNITNITLSPSSGYMNPNFWENIPPLLQGISAFIANAGNVLSLFQGRSTDLWEIAETLAAMGSDIVIIYGGMKGHLVFDKPGNKRWFVPAYPVKIVDPTGSEDAFCGGFLPGFKSTFQPLEGVLTACISASMMMEGIGPFYVLDSMPGLAEARLKALRNMVRRV